MPTSFSPSRSELRPGSHSASRSCGRFLPLLPRREERDGERRAVSSARHPLSPTLSPSDSPRLRASAAGGAREKRPADYGPTNNFGMHGGSHTPTTRACRIGGIVIVATNCPPRNPPRPHDVAQPDRRLHRRGLPGEGPVARWTRRPAHLVETRVARSARAAADGRGAGGISGGRLGRADYHRGKKLRNPDVFARDELI